MAKKKVKSKAKQPVKSSIPDSISSEVIAEACSSVTLPVFMKVCRLCESKDGPFLNIFDADKVTARKIDELMPFGIAENDDLPHKICFRCSAKLEELYEFIQKCIKTQENLRTAVGKTGPFIIKTKTRKAWEDKLNKTNMSNDDICDALIKKAMEGIKDIPLKPMPKDEVEEAPPPTTKRVTRRTDPKLIKKELINDENEFIINIKENKLSQQKNDEKVPTKLTRSTNNLDKSNTSIQSNNIKPPQPTINNEKNPSENNAKNNSQIINLSIDYSEEKSSDNEVEIKESVEEKPFNIMDYISMIKVNGVGVLFQCKLCNRNFLKKEVVESHNCAKNGIKSTKNLAIPKLVPTPEPPKVSTVKYITIEDNKKPHSWNSYKFHNDNSNVNEIKSDKPKADNNKDISIKQEQSVQSVPPVKPKRKAGPASKTRRTEVNSDTASSESSSHSQNSQVLNFQSPSVQIPSAPNLNSRFKLVPGPNNIFTLVEDTTAATEATSVTEKQKTAKKRKSEPEHEKPKDRKKDSPDKSKSSEVIDIEDQSMPYPVGLFQTVASTPAPFTTPAMKKQSYTIVQTGNPSKLLISTKAVAPPAEVPKKRQRKARLEARENSESKETDQSQPYRVTLEDDVAHSKDAGFFTFINVDPLLQPSYVLPTDNIIQESQISTSTAAIHNAAQGSKDKDKDKYPCNMCGESFSREKKLLSHIQSHYTKMDEEDQERSEKSTKKKGRK